MTIITFVLLGVSVIVGLGSDVDVGTSAGGFKIRSIATSTSRHQDSVGEVPPEEVLLSASPSTFSPSIQNIPPTPSSSLPTEFLELLQSASARAVRPEYDGGRFAKWVVFVPLNAGFLLMAKSMHHHLNSIVPPLRNVVWVALDNASYDGMRAFDSTALVYRDKLSDENFDTSSQHFRTRGYNTIVLHKWRIIQSIIEAGYDTLLLDADVVLLRNPIHYLIDGPSCDLYVSLDGETQNWDRLDEMRYSTRSEGYTYNIYVNTGMLYLRASNLTWSVVTEFLLPGSRVEGMDDQMEFNVYLQKRSNYTKSQYTLPKFQQTKQCSLVSGIPTLILPTILFGNTKHFEVLQNNARSGIVPYTYHYNYFSGFIQKRDAMIKNGHYFGGA